MITKRELQDYAKSLSLGNAEKDYLIDIALTSISSHTKNQLVFKGGTCLYKFYKLPRFSEDIDFRATSIINVNELISQVIFDFNKWGVKAKVHQKKETYNSILITLRIEGPLFTGNSATYANLGIDINLKSPVIAEPELLTYNSVYPDISMVSALCMKQEEIFAEKIRAIMSRERARDLFDLHFLLNNGVYADKELINKKLEYYNDKFDLNKLITKMKALQGQWKNELMGFPSTLLEFDVVYKYVVACLQKRYR